MVRQYKMKYGFDEWLDNTEIEWHLRDFFDYLGLTGMVFTSIPGETNDIVSFRISGGYDDGCV